MKHSTVHDQFQDCLANNRKRIAIIGGGQALTYAELNKKAEVVARGLSAAGLAQSRVAIIAMDRSVDFIVAILAVVKLGAVYVPARRGTSSADLQQLVKQTGAACAIVDAVQHSHIESVSIALFETLAREQLNEPLPKVERDRDDCLYIMFTSGSTGAPKGVMVPDRAVLRLVRDTNFTTISPEDTIFLTADPAFDASTFEIWGALLNGATIIAEGSEFDPNLLAENIEKHEVTVLWLTAGLFHVLGVNRPQMFRPLRQLLAGGDVLNASIVRNVLQVCPDLEIVNGYGPTENTTFTCCHRMTTLNPPIDSVPIGLPVTGTSVYLLDDAGKIVPPGTSGTLFVCGDGVALGYLGRPDDTAFAYVPKLSNTRLYNTGDSAVFKDGVYHFLGRRDSVVKIRGYRVSTNFVLERIYCLSYVQEAALCVESDPNLGKRIIAHLRLGDSTKSIAEIRDDCLSLMPPFMVPETIKIVDHISLTSNGKVQPRAELR